MTQPKHKRKSALIDITIIEIINICTGKAIQIEIKPASMMKAITKTIIDQIIFKKVNLLHL